MPLFEGGAALLISTLKSMGREREAMEPALLSICAGLIAVCLIGAFMLVTVLKEFRSRDKSCRNRWLWSLIKENCFEMLVSSIGVILLSVVLLLYTIHDYQTEKLPLEQTKGNASLQIQEEMSSDSLLDTASRAPDGAYILPEMLGHAGFDRISYADSDESYIIFTRADGASIWLLMPPEDAAFYEITCISCKNGEGSITFRCPPTEDDYLLVKIFNQSYGISEKLMHALVLFVDTV